MSLLFRKADFGKLDLEARTVPVVLATDYPVTRDGYTEILNLARVDLSRGDLPLIESHNANQLNIGVIRSIRVDGNKLRGVAVFGTSARASEVLNDVQAGIVTGVSIGYRITDEGAPVPSAGPYARAFGFMPYEASVVAIPADPTAGFFRSQPTLLTPLNHQVTTMEKTTQTTTIETRNHAAEISTIATGIPGGAGLAMRAIQEGKTVEEFQQIAIKAMSNKPVPTSDISGFYGAASVRSQPKAPQVLRSASDFARHYAGDSAPISLGEFMRGVARMKTTPEASRALSVGTDSAGGYAVPRVVMPGILAALSPSSSLLTAGVGIVPLPDEGKDFTFAAVDVLPTASWRFENGLVAASEPTFKNITLTPRSLSFVVIVSRELLADGVNIEAALSQAIGQAFAKEIDRVGLRGSGTAPEPRGLLNTASVNAVGNGANGVLLGSYANIFSAVQAILQADAPTPTAAIMAPRSFVRLGGLTDTTGQPIAPPVMLASMKLVPTSQAPIALTVGTSTDCSEIYVGDFSNMVFGMRENLSIQVLQETYAGNGQIGFLCHARLDVAVLYPKAFAVVTGVR